MLYFDDLTFLNNSVGYISSQNCDFEDTDACKWTQYKNDKFDWTRQTGKTGTGNTGASTDHTSLVKKLPGNY